MVLKTYKHASGGTAYDVRDEATGEVLTVVENATAEQVRAAVKNEATAQPAKPAAKPAAKPDPILQPQTYNTDARLQKKFAAAPSPPANPSSQSSQYTREPVPATKRWFCWMRRDAPPPAPPQTQSRKPAPAAPAPAAAPTVIPAAYHPDPVFRLIGRLRDDDLPSMREVAAMELAANWRGRAEAVAALADAARTDPAPSVRACCARCIGEMGARSPECLAVLRTLTNDGDENVRSTASVVLTSLQQP